MKNISITGYSGFIGKNILKSKFFENYTFHKINLRKNEKINNESYSIIHLAGIAHDLTNNFNKKNYIDINYKLTRKVFKEFLKSKNKVFIFFSSIKTLGDNIDEKISEKLEAKPNTAYGYSKLKAEKYILKKTKKINKKRVYILRPSMIHGNTKKGNLYLLYKYIKNGLPWPFILFENKRSYLNIKNLNYIVNKLITNKNIPSGVYNVCDSEYLSTNEIIKIIKSETKTKNLNIYVPKIIIKILFKFLDLLNSRYNTKMLNKIVGNCLVDNTKLLKALKTKLPYNSKNEMIKTIKNFK